MTTREPRRRTGDPELDRRLADLLDEIGATSNRDQLLDLLATVVRLAADSSDRLDLKIASAALGEMADGFELFAPYRAVRKITMFGSARTASSDPLYAQARDLAALLAAHGWSTVTGAGPGIMAAGLEGAGPEHAFGINIRLPFEQGANEFIASDPKLVSMKYFFTRKLLLIKESYGYAVLPGGFGTLDEAFELLTLLQTGKAEPAPVVLLDVPGGTYWRAWEDFVTRQVESRRLISPGDRVLYRIVDDVGAAAAEILGFYRNFHSVRWVGDTLVVRLESRPTEAEVDDLTERFSDVVKGRIEVRDGPLPAERRGQGGFPDLPRLVLRFDRVSYARLRELIDAVNDLPSAPPPPIAATGTEA
ncbi:MAG TPA: LOG family protein [Acidimicrobiales bacterium]|nr:LOG family protein [Acidimicrobiales bacterium]